MACDSPRCRGGFAGYEVAPGPVAQVLPTIVDWPKGRAVVAISATNLQGTNLRQEFIPLYVPLREAKPVAVLGGSIYLFAVEGAQWQPSH